MYYIIRIKLGATGENFNPANYWIGWVVWPRSVDWIQKNALVESPEYSFHSSIRTQTIAPLDHKKVDSESTRESTRSQLRVDFGSTIERYAYKGGRFLGLFTEKPYPKYQKAIPCHTHFSTDVGAPHVVLVLDNAALVLPSGYGTLRGSQ